MVAATSGFAQETPRERQQAHRDEIGKMVDAYIAMNVEEKLGLTDDQFVKVLPFIKRLQSDRRRFAERRIEILHELKERLESGASTEVQVASLVKDLHVLEDEEPTTLRKDRDAVDQFLSVVQQAKFRVLQMEVERTIRALIQQQRGGQGQGQGPGGRAQGGGPRPNARQGE
jgi:hypothetical protein